MTNIKNNRDANEREIIEAMKKLGCVIIQMDRMAGFDLLVITPPAGEVEIVEIKNPAHKWTLTDAECKRQKEVESVGGVYWVVEDIEDCLEVVYFVRKT